MPKDFRATALERAVGRKLATWRDVRGLSLFEAGRRVGFSSAKLSMMENAIQPSAVFDVMALGFIYKVPTAESQAVMSQTQRAAELRTFRQPQAADLDPADDFPSLLADATRLRTFAVDSVPTVLRLPDYSAAMSQQCDPTNAATLVRIWEAWTSRASGTDCLAVEAVLPEAALRHLVGGKRDLKAQLLHLIEVSVRPEVSLRVVPHSAATYPVMNLSFAWMSFPHRQHNDVVYTETFLRSEYLESRGEVEQVANRFSALRQLALDEDESLEFIAETAARL
ncbi:DUF5753 domain-containing protein [Lentzea cavernae]|uniref:Transcriptional regulator n=1 Tax=Lentzea cavernae TaxID=2020703 RepID=A0ABQ3ML31_9PSEU|nr:DUF5753 domain-containing protein [Lentzea cavernae]GHH42043.1 transcriptional regulator [Lentzea cavernae]